MSFELVDAILQQLDPRLSRVEEIVLLLLARDGDGADVAWTGTRRLAKRGHMHRRTVQRALDALKRSGILVVLTAGKRGRGHSTHHRICWPPPAAAIALGVEPTVFPARKGGPTPPFTSNTTTWTKGGPGARKRRSHTARTYQEPTDYTVGAGVRAYGSSRSGAAAARKIAPRRRCP